MQTKTWITFLGLLMGGLLIAYGCGERAQETAPKEEVAAPVEQAVPKEDVKVEESKPVEEAKVEEAAPVVEEKTDLLKIRELAMKEKEIILAQKDEVQKLIEKKANIPVTAQLGEEAKKLTQEIAEHNNLIKEHMDRYNGYIEQLKAGNVDMSGLEM
jgi:hypothetical protein